MVPQAPVRRQRNSSKVNLLISFAFHGAIIVALFYFAAREGLLGKELKKIAVEWVKEKAPEEKKPEAEKPAEEVAKAEPPELEPAKETPPPTAPPPDATRDGASAPPPATDLAAPPVVAPPSVDVPSFTFGGGRAVRTSSDPVQLYKGFIEYSLRSRWNRPTDVEDHLFVAEVEVSVDTTGRLSDPAWKKGSGHDRWDSSVRQAIAATPTVNRAPPTNFPSRILVRFDVLEVEDAVDEKP